MEHCVNETLKCLGCIAQPERHFDKFEKAKQGDNSCFVDISSFNRYLVVCSAQIHLGKDGCCIETGGKILYVEYWIVVWYSYAV